MSKKKDLKLAAKVEKKQKRREEKAAKKLKKEAKKKEEKQNKREEKRRAEKLKKSLKKQEKEEKKKLKREKKKLKKDKKKLKKEQKELKKLSKMRSDKVEVASENIENAPKTQSSDKDALQFMATFGGKVKKEKKRSEDADANEKKPVKVSAGLVTFGITDVNRIARVARTGASSGSDVVNGSVVNADNIPTPVTTPQPKISTEPVAITKPAVTATNISTGPSAVRKPVGIRTPGANREINPIYTRPIPMASASVITSDFIIPGVNDTEEARILTRTFADKWILPANLYKIEASTGLKYRRGRFSDAEKILAMKLTTKFCQEQNMSLERFKTIFFDDMGTENGHQNRLSNFFVDVSQHFGGRPVVAVYDFLKRLYHPGNHRGPWTPEEDQVLLREFQKHGPKWTLIGKELNRLGINCRDRYNIRWKHVGRMVNGPWSEEEDEKLINAIKESVEASGSISWLWISEERVKVRTPLQCLIRWKYIKKGNTDDSQVLANIKKRSVVPSSVKPKVPKVVSWSGWKEDEDYLLIHAILTSGAVSDETIQWKDLKIQGIPEARHNPELFFRRWNHLKAKAEISDETDLKETVEKVKKYLIKLSKSPAYIFSEDEEDIF